MPTTYPPAPPTIDGQRISVDRLVNNPVLVYRLLRSLVQQRLVGGLILSGRVDLTGSGSAVFEVAESIFSDLPSERVAPLMEYPLTTDTPGVISTVSTDKWALATEISDELIARNRMDLVTRKLLKLANRIAFGFDQLVLSAVASAVTQTQPASAAWNGAGADPFLDAMLAGAIPDSLNQGYTVDTILCTPVYFARLLSAAKVIERAPREAADSMLLTGRMVEIAGLRIVKTTNLPPGVNVMVLDSTQLGSIAYEEIGGGYTGSAADGVQTKTYRKEGNDGVRIQGPPRAGPDDPGDRCRREADGRLMAAIGVAPLTLVKRTNGTMEYVYYGQNAPADAAPGELDRLIADGYLARAVEIVAVPVVVEQPPPDSPVQAPAARPVQVAPKGAWVDYAVSQGAEREAAEALTKEKLIEQYGG